MGLVYWLLACLYFDKAVENRSNSTFIRVNDSIVCLLLIGLTIREAFL